MEEKRKVVTYASGSPQLLSEFGDSFTPLNLGGGKKNPNSTSEELNVAWQQNTLSDVKVNTHSTTFFSPKRKSMLLTETLIAFDCA